jgi:hypothetical protein
MLCPDGDLPTPFYLSRPQNTFIFNYALPIRVDRKIRECRQQLFTILKAGARVIRQHLPYDATPFRRNMWEPSQRINKSTLFNVVSWRIQPIIPNLSMDKAV